MFINRALIKFAQGTEKNYSSSIVSITNNIYFISNSLVYEFFNKAINCKWTNYQNNNDSTYIDYIFTVLSIENFK